MKKRTERQKLTKKMDDLFSKIIRSDGRCKKCGSTSGLQCAHVISRKYVWTRWDIDNALPLCLKHHIYWMHKEPHEFVEWFNGMFGADRYETLKGRANNLGKFDYESKLAELKSLHERIR